MTKKQAETLSFKEEYEQIKALIPHFLVEVIKKKDESNLTKIEAMKCLIEFDTKYSVIFQ